MIKKYRIFKKFGKEHIETNDILRVDLFNNFKIKDVPELKNFSFIYFQSGHNDKRSKTRYIKVFKKSN